ncbi:MAG TPA: type II CRISPR-associated endonuclease Cas1 [Clostridiales bacterium]|nr:type II CRISPR-associated endonuclease Cas1 [Clostridiales bacterium]
MGFRTVTINSRCKLELKLNYMVCKGDQIQRVFLDEISTVIIHSTAVVITTALLSEFVKRNIKVIICNEKHNPVAELLPYYGSYNNALKLKQQLGWGIKTKQMVWTEIVAKKIINQSKHLRFLGKKEDADKMLEYANQVELNDVTNREGHAAKLYFASLFSKDWSRDCGDFYSKALNYGYIVLLSTFNREIVKSGYLTQLGIWHENQFNDFNLSCDLIEPFRPIVDRIVYKLDKNDENFKTSILKMTEKQVYISGKLMFLENAIEVYIRSVFSALNENNPELILNYEL